VARYFRPTLLLALDLTNTQLGLIQAAYGVVAMLAYFPGGFLADLFSTRVLLTASLATTALGGCYFASFPGYEGLWLLFGFWGLTTILLFWAALIRATREWGARDAQGYAYGILDGGRGLFAAVMASAAVLIFEASFPGDSTGITNAQRLDALRSVIFFYTAMTLASAVLSWLFVTGSQVSSPGPRVSSGLLTRIRQVFHLPGVWVQALIVMCAYVGYKGIDNYSLFAVQAHGMSEVDGARISAFGAWVRPVAAVGVGLLGDRIRCSRAASVCFALLCGSYLWFALHTPEPSMAWILFANIAVTSAAIYGLRAVYFGLFEEGSVPPAVTGTAIGLVSVIGYTPDVFIGPLGGWILDRSPGLAGHQHYFLMLLAFAGIGWLASAIFPRIATRRQRA
jgi:sugar phosphate permease